MRKVAVLGAVAALLAAYLLFGDRGSELGDGAREQVRLAPAFDRAAVTRIVISRAGTAPFSLDRQPAGREPAWRESPGDKPADGAAVEDLLNAIDAAETTRTADVSLAEAGLAPPRLSMEIDWPGGSVTVALGRTDAGGKGVFSRVGDAAAIRVAPRRLLELADREAWAFRDRRVVPLPADAVTAIGWRGKDSGSEQRVRLVDGRWQNETERAVANERVAESLRRLLALQVMRYEPARPAVVGPPRIFVEGVRGTTIVLTTDGSTCADPGGAFVERDGPTGDGLCVDPEALRQLWPALTAAHAPDLRLVSSPPATIKRIAIDERGARLVLTRAPAGGWRLDVPKVAYAVDPRAVDDWLSALGRAEVRPPPAAANLRRRHLVVEGRYREEVEVSPGDPGYALVEPDPRRFRDRAVLDFAHFDARDLKRAVTGRTVEIASSDGDDWRAVAPAGARIDRTNAARVVGALGNLRAESFVAGALRGRPEVVLGVAVAPPGTEAAQRHTLEIFARPKPGCTGRLDAETTFTLSPPACAELRTPLEASPAARP
jgi:hypothetical protein